jgi:hypothetical protein
MVGVVEQLISDIEAYAKARSMTPERVLRVALNARWDTWSRWKSGEADCTTKTIRKVRSFMAANPAARSEAA